MKTDQYTFEYAEKTDVELARHINLALLLCDGISEQNAGFDMVISINDAGIDAVARIIGKIRASCGHQQNKDSETEA